MSELFEIRPSFFRKILYRLATSVFSIAGFVFFQSVTNEYLNTPYYAGWIGLVGALAVLTTTRILFGTFKSYEKSPVRFPEFIFNEPVTNTRVSNMTPKQPMNTVIDYTSTTQPFAAPTSQSSEFTPNLTARPNPSSSVPSLRSYLSKLGIQNPENESIERILLDKINLVQIKQQKLEGMRNVINPRVYDVLKRQYEMEKQYLLDDFANEQQLTPTQESGSDPVPDHPSAVKPQIITEPEELNEEELLERFKTLDKLLTNRLEKMKIYNTSSIPKNSPKKEKEALEVIIQ